MTYRIEYDYQTGDSFHTEERTEVLEYDWEDLEIAKEALQRIKEHYKWYRYVERVPYPDRPKVKKPKWWKVNTEGLDEDYQHHLMNLRMDNGVEVQFHPPWCGYFETLYGASIINKKSGDISFRAFD